MKQIDDRLCRAKVLVTVTNEDIEWPIALRGGLLRESRRQSDGWGSLLASLELEELLSGLPGDSFGKVTILSTLIGRPLLSHEAAAWRMESRTLLAGAP